jgi:alkanesulfonate monooxygenase SsuD/methylene tetrahydromethanopterin reductase-like flavin-dependent oxidoreductase (luciferase family)
MNVGIYFDLRNPPQWYQDPARLFAFTLEMCEEADHLGIHSAWFTEHHLFEDGYLSQPLTMAAAAAARTKRMRIGTAILVAPLRSAVQIAEEAAIVDIISGGRLDLGLGAGYRVPEFDLFGADLSCRYTTTVQRVEELRSIWREGEVTPRPVQEDIPIWLGFNGPQGARRAGRLGENLLSADPALWDPYREGLADAGHDPSRGRMTGVIHGFVSDDPERDWEIIKPYLAYQFDSYRQYNVEGTDKPKPSRVDPDAIRAREMGGSLSYFVHGTPEEMAGRVNEYIGEAPVETVFFFLSVAGTPEDLVSRHLQSLATGLVPLLAND